jgi:hypothetical protein
LSRTGSTAVLTCVSWNAEIPASSTIEIGFTAMHLTGLTSYPHSIVASYGHPAAATHLQEAVGAQSRALPVATATVSTPPAAPVASGQATSSLGKEALLLQNSCGLRQISHTCENGSLYKSEKSFMRSTHICKHCGQHKSAHAENRVSSYL